jgi:hypothetical protein
LAEPTGARSRSLAASNGLARLEALHVPADVFADVQLRELWPTLSTEAELDRREAALARADQEFARLESLHVPTDEFADVSLRELWPTLSTDERRRALADVIDCVVLRRGPERLEGHTFVIPAGRERDYEPLPERGRLVPFIPFPFDELKAKPGCRSASAEATTAPRLRRSAAGSGASSCPSARRLTPRPRGSWSDR